MTQAVWHALGVAQELDAIDVTRRIARSVQTTVGWTFWDLGAIEIR